MVLGFLLLLGCFLRFQFLAQLGNAAGESILASYTKEKRELAVKGCSRFRVYFILMFFIFADESFMSRSSTASVYLTSLHNLFLKMSIYASDVFLTSLTTVSTLLVCGNISKALLFASL